MKRRIEGCPANLFWFDSRYNKILSILLEDFSYIIKQTVEKIDRHEEFTKIRNKIESFFKIAKIMFGLKDLHVYYRKYAITEIKTIFYTTQLFCQFCLKNRINMERFVEISRKKL